MLAEIAPGKLNGNIQAIPSKSDAQRALIISCLAQGSSTIRFNQLSQDTQACMDCLKQFGAQIEIDSQDSTLYHIKPQAKPMAKYYNVGESATCLRLLLPVLACYNQGQTLQIERQGSLIKRPNGPLQDLFTQAGLEWREDGASIYLSGQLSAGDYQLPGNVSSQFISGMLIALASLNQPSSLRLTTPLESAPYVDLTLACQEKFGQKITFDIGQQTYFIHIGRYQSCHYQVVGDWSNALYLLLGGATVHGLNLQSVQADRLALEPLQKMGWQVRETAGHGISLEADFSRLEHRDLTIDVSQFPDAFPALALAASITPSETQLVNGGRLRIKESDRIESTSHMLQVLGVDFERREDGLVIRGGRLLHGGRVNSQGDHRIAMTAAIAATFAQASVLIEDAQAVAKSYPNFYQDMRSLGGCAYVV